MVEGGTTDGCCDSGGGGVKDSVEGTAGVELFSWSLVPSLVGRLCVYCGGAGAGKLSVDRLAL